MPNIREYRSQANIQPSNVPATIAARVGEGARQMWTGLGQNVESAVSAIVPVAQKMYERRVVQPEVSRGALEATRQVDALTRQWNDMARGSDPNDTSIQPRFMEEVLEPALTQFEESFTTPEAQEWARGQVAKIRNHFSTTINADMSSRAGVAAVSNVEEASSFATNTAYNDPSSLDFVLEQMKDTFDATMAGTDLDAVAAAKFGAELRTQQREVAFAGLKGFADRNPNQFLADLAAGEFDKYNEYLDAEDKLALRQYGEARKSAATEDANAARIAQERLEKAGIKLAVNAVLQENLEVSEDGNLHIKEGAYAAALNLGGLPGADENTVTSVVSALRAIQNDEAKRIARKSDPYTVADFNDRLFLDDNDPNKLTIEEVARARAPNGEAPPMLSNQDFNYYRQQLLTKDPEELEDRKYFNENIKRWTGFINQSTFFSKGTPEAQQRENEFRRDKWEEFRTKRRAGKSRDEAFTGIETNLQMYQVPADASIKGITERAGSGGTPLPPVQPVSPDKAWKQGESMEDYAKRLQGQ